MAEDLKQEVEQVTLETKTQTQTPEEIERLIQAESDRKVTLARQRWEKETSKKLTEAEKLARMSEEDKLRYNLELKEKEWAERERQYVLKDNRIAAMKVMADKQLPVDLVDFVVNEDADVMRSNIELLERHVKAAVAAEVKQRLASPTPRAGLVNTGLPDKAAFQKMSTAERNALYVNNRALYDQLKG
jgi:hypothetical protein